MDWAYIDPTDSSQLYSIGKKHIYVFKKKKYPKNTTDFADKLVS